jgi:hypothetical protein
MQLFTSVPSSSTEQAPQCRVTADVTAGQVEIVADEVDQQSSGVDLALVLLTVYVDGDRLAGDSLHLFPSCGLCDRA